MIDIHGGMAPLIVAFPHAGTEIPADVAHALAAPWRARKDTDWHLPKLYDFAQALGATTIATKISRTVIDVNRDPDGASLYPGKATTDLCPLTTFDGEALYAGAGPDRAEIAARRNLYFYPFHLALEAEIARLHKLHGIVVLYDAHSIRSRIPRLFDGALPHLNIGTNDGASCDGALTAAVEAACAAHAPFTRVTNGRFKGGWTTRHYGAPREGIHAIQMELACRGYMDEPDAPDERNWPAPYDAARAAPMRAALMDILTACRDFALARSRA